MDSDCALSLDDSLEDPMFECDILANNSSDSEDEVLAYDESTDPQYLGKYYYNNSLFSVFLNYFVFIILDAPDFYSETKERLQQRLRKMNLASASTSKSVQFTTDRNSDATNPEQSGLFINFCIKY